MENEKENLEVVEQQPQDNQIYIDALKDINSKMVPIERFNKMVNERDNLWNTLVSGGQVATAEAVTEKEPIENIVKDMRNLRGANDIKFYEKALEFRKRVLEETGEDCFVSRGHNVAPTAESYAKAERNAQIYQECLDYANGDNKVFINELQRRMNESPLANYKNRR